MLASGVTAIAGFAALTATDIRMLRDFGLVTVLDLGVALAGVMLVLPAALVWAETGFAPPRVALRRRRRGVAAGARPGMSDEPTRGRPTGGASPARRYSLFVGIAFVIVIVIAPVEHAADRATTASSARPRPRRARRCPQFAVPELLGSTGGRRQRLPGRLRDLREPCPDDERRTPACEVDLPEVIRVCDLFDRPLVISFWFTRGADCLPTQDVFDEVAQRYARQGQLPLDQRPRRARRGARDRPRARLAVPGRLGRRRRRLQPLPRRRLPDASPSPIPGGILSEAAIGSESSPSRSSRALDRLIRESERRAEEDR